MSVQAAWWSAAAASAALALVAATGERRRRQREDPDAVGWIDWPTVQVAALVGALLCVSIALHA